MWPIFVVAFMAIWVMSNFWLACSLIVSTLIGYGLAQPTRERGSDDYVW